MILPALFFAASISFLAPGTCLSNYPNRVAVVGTAKDREGRFNCTLYTHLPLPCPYPLKQLDGTRHCPVCGLLHQKPLHSASLVIVPMSWRRSEVMRFVEVRYPLCAILTSVIVIPVVLTAYIARVTSKRMFLLVVTRKRSLHIRCLNSPDSTRLHCGLHIIPEERL